MTLLDSDVIIDFFAGVEPSRSAVAECLGQRSAAISAMTLFELIAGVTGRKRLDQVLTFSRLLPVIDVNREQALLAASIYTDLKTKGQLIGNQDILIGAAALQSNIPLMTRNQKHFKRIPNLELLDPRVL